jgi:hypothetical protein
MRLTGAARVNYGRGRREGRADACAARFAAAYLDFAPLHVLFSFVIPAATLIFHVAIRT